MNLIKKGIRYKNAQDNRKILDVLLDVGHGNIQEQQDIQKQRKYSSYPGYFDYKHV